MKKICMLATALLLVSQLNLMAQTTEIGTKRTTTLEERIEKKSARIAQQLLLSDAEIAKFTPLYKKYREEMRALYPQKVDQKKNETTPLASKKERVTPTDDEMRKVAKERFARQRKMIDLQEKYYNEFSKFLNPKQVERIVSFAVAKGDKGRDNTRGIDSSQKKNKRGEAKGKGEMRKRGKNQSNESKKRA